MHLTPKYTSVGKICVLFDRNYRLSRKRYEMDGDPQLAYYGSLTGSHSYPVDPHRLWRLWVTLKVGTRGVNFSSGSPQSRSHRLTYRTTKLGMVTRMQEGRVLRASYATSQGTGPQSSPFLNLLHTPHTVRHTTTTKILHGDQTTREENWVNHASAMTKNFCETN